MNLKSYIREYQDFPKPEINFKDIAPILASYEAMHYIKTQFYNHYKDKSFDIVAGAESRGLIFAAAFAMEVKKGCIMIRKQGKLPGDTDKIEYGLEYGEAVLEIQKDAIKKGDKVLLVDDLLATGGTAKAASKLVEMQGGEVVGHAFIIELSFLKGRNLLKEYDVKTLVTYDK